LEGHGFTGCGKNSMLHLILGGAALQRCGKCIVLNPALAAEVKLSAREPVLSQPVQPDVATRDSEPALCI